MDEVAKKIRKKRRFRAVVIGVGFGMGHARQLLAIEDVELVGVCDKEQARLKRACAAAGEVGVKLDETRLFRDYKRMLRRVAPDVAVVALPNFLHAPVTIDCLNAGCHVFCEKPMALSLRQAERMVAAARRNRRQLMINMSFRFGREAAALKQIVDAGQLGEVYFARTGWMRQNGIPRGTGWFYRKELSGGGPLIDLGVHRIDLAWYLMGEPRVLSVSGQVFTKLAKKIKGYSVEDLAAGFVRFRDGRCMQVAASWASYCQTPEAMWTELFGTRGGAVQRNVGGGYSLEVRVFKEVAGYRVDTGPIGAPPTVPSSVHHLIESLRTGRTPGPSGEKVLEVQKILDGLYRSAETGREVRFA